MVDMVFIKNSQKILSTAVFASLLMPGLASAFMVKDIEVEGTNKIGFETINSYLTFSKGERLDSQAVQDSLQQLYKTGFFNDVAIYKRDDGTLVIKVEERPSITKVEINGNSLIETDVLTTALEGLGIKQGRIYNKLRMDQVIVDLKRRYQNQGYYGARVEIDAKTLPRQRVALTINITEGAPATMGRINLVGNKVYSDKRLKEQMQTQENVVFGSGDEYSKPKLQADIETIKSYYMDRGYAEFKVRSSQVSLSADKTKVFSTINITEGPQYEFAEINYLGDLIIDEDEMAGLVNFESGDVFSRKKVIDSVNAIRDRLSEEGYAFAEVVPDTRLNKENQTLQLNFQVEPKNRVYIRRIEIKGNTRTRDHVIRREMRQFESAPYSLKMVRQSKQRLQKLGFFKSADIETQRVSADEVDLVINVEEQATGSISAGVGYSQLDGVSFNLGVSERNFIGSGNKLNFNVNTSAARKSLDIGVTNPYFTQDGVSLGTGIYYSEIDAEELEVADYTTNNLGVRATLGYPLSETTQINYGLKLDSQDLVCSPTFNFCNDYKAENDAKANSVFASISWVRNTTNAFYFPTQGRKTSLSLEASVPGISDQPFYKIFANDSWFKPLSDNFTLQLKGGISYGDGYGDLDGLPFYERFYAGGIGSVRGFEPNSLGGDYDLNTDGSDRPIGGDLKLAGTAAIVSPIPFLDDSTNARLSVFFDFGNVFDTKNKFAQMSDFDANELRTSTGIGVSWITPVGPLTFSVARPISYDKQIDEKQSFQFTLGAGF